MTKFKHIALVLLISFILLLTGCDVKVNIDDPVEDENFVESVRLSALNDVSYEFNQKDFEDSELFIKLSKFAGSIFELGNKNNEEDNYCVSPLSLYMAFSILHYIGDDIVKKEIEELFEMNSEDISASGKLFLKMINESIFDDEVISRLLLTNSIWIDNGEIANQIVLDELAKNYYCYAYKTPFALNNKKANEEIREFIKEKTYGLIDKDFELNDDTIFAIINTLYFKDVWKNGEPLNMALRNFDVNGEKVIKPFIYSNYQDGCVKNNELCSYFYTQTMNKYKIKFIVPNDNYTLEECMTKENINEVNLCQDYESCINIIKTRCVFPAFKVSSFTAYKDILEENGYLPHTFTSYKTNLLKSSFFVSSISHQVELDVNDEGVEAAAVTIIASEKNGGFNPEIIYQDFVINKNFGFIITDENDIVLFVGTIKNPETKVNIENLSIIKD